MKSMARQNVRGNNGPDRKELPNFKLLGALSFTDSALVLGAAQHILAEVGEDYNDINNETYRVAQDCPLKTYFPPTYRQVLIQTPITDGVAEEDYRCIPALDGKSRITIYHVLKIFGLNDFYRARLAILPPGGVLDWHIDTNTSVSCRVQIPIMGDCIWEIRRKKEVEARVLTPFQVSFTNTGYAHRVSNPHPTEDRVCLTIGCHYDAIKKWFE